MITLTPYDNSFLVEIGAISDLDIVGYRLHAVQADKLVNGNFTPNKETDTIVIEVPASATAPTISFACNVPTIGTWYVKVAAYDMFGDDEIVYSDLLSVEVVLTPRFTHIDEYGIYTGTLTAEQINALGMLTVGVKSTAIDGNRYSSLTDGDLTFYKLNEDGVYDPYKFMRQVQTGEGVSGTPVELLDFDREPAIQISASHIKSYDFNYPGQSQYTVVGLSSTGVTYREATETEPAAYLFTPEAKLIRGNTGASLPINVSKTDTTVASFSYAPVAPKIPKTPAAVTKITINGELKSTLRQSYNATTKISTCRNRKCTMYIKYRALGDTTWTIGPSSVYTDWLDNVNKPFTLSTPDLALNTYEFYVYGTFATDGTGTFTSKTILSGTRNSYKLVSASFVYPEITTIFTDEYDGKVNWMAIA